MNMTALDDDSSCIILVAVAAWGVTRTDTGCTLRRSYFVTPCLAPTACLPLPVPVAVHVHVQEGMYPNRTRPGYANFTPAHGTRPSVGRLHTARNTCTFQSNYMTVHDVQ